MIFRRGHAVQYLIWHCHRHHLRPQHLRTQGRDSACASNGETSGRHAGRHPLDLPYQVGPGRVKEPCRTEGPEKSFRRTQIHYRVDQIVSKLHRANGNPGKGKKVSEV